jgi:hypothetical protein
MGNPTVTPLSEQWHEGGFMVWEPSNGIVTREQITLLSGAGVCTAGLVLGKAAVSTAGAVFAALGANTGNPTCGAITVAAPAVAGEYDIVMDDATHFHVLAPPGGAGVPGEEVGHGVFAAAFAAGGLGFTLTAGGTACVRGLGQAASPGAGAPRRPSLEPLPWSLWTSSVRTRSRPSSSPRRSSACPTSRWASAP